MLRYSGMYPQHVLRNVIVMVAQWAMVRAILCVSLCDRIRSEKVRRRTKVTDIATKMFGLQLAAKVIFQFNVLKTSQVRFL